MASFPQPDQNNSGSLKRRRASWRLGDRLVTDGLISEAQLHQCLERQKVAGGFLGDLIVSSGAVTAHQIRGYLEALTGFPFIDVVEEEVDRELATSIPESFVTLHKVLPIREVDGQIHVAMADPLNLSVVDELKLLLGQPVVPCLALASDLEVAVRRNFDVRQRTQSLLDEITIVTNDETRDEQSDSDAGSDDAPVVRLVNSILGGAMAAGASDIHIEPQEKSVRIRYRIDGVMYEQMTMSSTHLAACVSRLKVMSGMDIAERRRPQDGRFSTVSEGGRKFDSRVSTMPTVFGEKVCMRLLEATYNFTTIEQLGFFPDQADLMGKFAKRPHGLVLVTGPTGSGKSTTLYAALQTINDSAKNINTVEDPVEYKLPGINQLQVNAKIGLTFSSGLRTLVRQDPDVILVGEIRDHDTAEVAVQAALTGHLVLSTLHTNDAPGALVRLQNMGVEPYLISSAVIGVMGQRLLRAICPACKTTIELTEQQALAMEIPVQNGKVPVLAKGEGCRRCGNRGTQGRTAAVEVMGMTDTLRDGVLLRKSGSELKTIALAEGMVTMRESAIRKALEHTVPPSEIIRVFSQED